MLNLVNCSIEEFFNEVRNKFYPEIDISFMEYFLQIINEENKFVIHHKELIKYGVMTSKRSSAVKNKIELLGMQCGKDYLVEDVLVKGNSGSQLHKHYYLTPGAFKKCLIRAKRHTGQTADPTIYSDYYVLLEKIHKLHSVYQKSYADKLLSAKDDKINELNALVEEQANRIKQLVG